MSGESDPLSIIGVLQSSLADPHYRAMTHDPATYHDPMTFKPERFLGTEGREPELSADSIVFGFGRRICPARMLATATVFLTVARSLAVFKISKAVEDGKEIDVEAKFQPKGISHPVPWRYSIEPRSAAHEVLIRSVEKEHPWENSNSSDLPDMEL